MIRSACHSITSAFGRISAAIAPKRQSRKSLTRHDEPGEADGVGKVGVWKTDHVSDFRAEGAGMSRLTEDVRRKENGKGAQDDDVKGITGLEVTPELERSTKAEGINDRTFLSSLHRRGGGSGHSVLLLVLEVLGGVLLDLERIRGGGGAVVHGLGAEEEDSDEN